MFTIDGWLTTSNVLERIMDSRELDGRMSGRGFDTSWGEERWDSGNPEFKLVCEDFWALCFSGVSVAAVGPAGQLLKCDRAMVEWDDPNVHYNPYFSILTSTYGTGLLTERPARIYFDASNGIKRLLTHKFLWPLTRRFVIDWANRLWWREPRLKPFYGFIIVLSEAEVNQYLATAQNTLSKPDSESGLAKKLVEKFDEIGPFTKSWAKKNLAHNISGRAFVRAWSRAAEQRPELSQPGRRR